jgi:PHD/YefM family antitoxin component YafN of YafNO toxin-antitoxin module
VHVVKVSSAEFQKNFGRYQDLALTEPVSVTRNGRERTVLLSTQEYHRLKRRDRQVLGVADFTQDDIDAIERAVAPAEAAKFDQEVG